MVLTAKPRGEWHILHKKAGVKSTMPEYTKISFNHRKDLADYGDLVLQGAGVLLSTKTGQ
jgi:hypothetical protein